MNQTLVTILGTTIAVGSISSLGWWYYYTRKEGSSSLSYQDDAPSKRSSTSTPQLSNYMSQKFKPPFPPKIRAMLSKCRLAYLSTADADSSSSHLSLMRFTYLHDPNDGEILIMSTNKNTKKFDMLERQRGVALLVHDFVRMENDDNDDDKNSDDGGGGGGGGTYSITLNGHCRILPNGSALAERYRQVHLQHNPQYSQFIVGPDIVILCVDVESARICDIQDQVTTWNVRDGYQ